MLRLLACLLSFVLAPLAADLRKDIEFVRRGTESLTLDASVPAGRGPFPTVIIVHGGGFVRGDKTTYVTPLFPVLTEAGFTWFTINYRLAPQHRFPAAIEDVEEAVRWVKKHAAEYKVDTSRIALVGESAGGHLVSYVGATTGSKLGLRAVVPFYAPHDFAARARASGEISEGLAGFVGVPQSPLTPDTYHALERSSPQTHIQKDMPPYLLIHGTKDTQVPYSQSVAMQEALRRQGVECDLYTVKDGAHGMGSWDKIPGGSEYKRYLVEWLRRKLH